jgi:hypothetical protein
VFQDKKLLFIAFVMFMAPLIVFAGEDTESADTIIRIGIGETKVLPFDWMNPFIADEEIATNK